jgi:hypothetical protein
MARYRREKIKKGDEEGSGPGIERERKGERERE